MLTVTSLIGLSIGSTNAQSTTGTDVYLTLTGGDLTIEATGSIDMGVLPVSTVATPVEYTFSGTTSEHFVVQDLKWAFSGYYTTIQASNLTDGVGNSIPASNVSLRVDPLNILLLAGSANSNVAFGPSVSTTFTLIDSAITFIKRDPATNNGLTGRYGVLPTLRVLVPAYQAVWVYSGTLTFTLFEN